MSTTDGNLKQLPVMVAGLREIQELHKPVAMPRGSSEVTMCSACPSYFPCATRQLADKALGETS